MDEEKKLDSENIERVAENIVKDSAPEPKEETVKSSEQLAEEYLNGWQRALADYKNLKRESESKSLEWLDMGSNRVIEKLLPVYTNFQTAVSHIPADQQKIPWVTGIMYIKQNLEDIFRELGLVKIETVGKALNTVEHEAVNEEEVPDSPLESGMIIKEVAPGFKKGEKVIVPARVIVKK